MQDLRNTVPDIKGLAALAAGKFNVGQRTRLWIKATLKGDNI